MTVLRRPAKPPASVRSMRRVVVGMVLVLAITLIADAVLEEAVSDHMSLALGYSEDNASWAVHQLEAEQQRLEIALLEAQGSPAPAALEQAALRYETFASRQNVLLTGVFHLKLGDLPAYGALMTAFDKFFADNDPMLADGLQAGEVASLAAAARAMRGPVHEMALAENAMLNQFQAEARANAMMVEELARTLQIGLGSVIAGFAFYAFVVLRRAQTYEAALIRSEHVLRDALQAAESANSAKSAFLANMSHELRTPLNAIIGFSEFLEISTAERLDERQRSYLTDIRTSGRHLLEILSTILELSKLEAGKVELAVAQVAPAGLIDECVRMLRQDADRKGVALEMAVPEGLPDILGDATRLRQIFINLLSNAIKYSSEGGRVRVSGERAADGFVSFRVEDEGIGMHHADIETALRPFERIRSPETSNLEGVGLGLTIVKTLVDIHGGQLHIGSEIGLGTIVTVKLPPAAGAAAASAGAAPALAHRRQAPGQRLAVAAD
jgi:two-component system cell cycle sensor histidine kinase PleC